MASLDHDSDRCPNCGSLLPTDAPAANLCPFCLYALGFDADSAETDKHRVPDPQLLPTDTVITDPPPTHPDRIGPYRILQPLKEGGMGIVYLAEQQEPIRRRVALKLIKLGLDSREVVARFESERQALALMDHPNIARVFDAGTAADGRPYFVMEYVPGLRITKYCDDHRLSNLERVRLFTLVCAAVHHAHQKGIIHRDLKPSNVLVTQHDGVPVPKIIDFGVAKALNQPLTQRTIFTHAGRIVGTIEYMSPEQAEGALDIDATSDIYALGVLLYELLVGTLPFDSRLLRQAGYAEMQRVIREDEPDRPSTRLSGLGDTAQEVARLRQTDLSSLARDLRGDLDWITMKAMEKDRVRRYASASEFASDLRRHLNDEPVAARPPSAWYRVSKFVRKHTAPVFACVAIVLALATALVISTLAFSRTELARRNLQQESYVANLRAADLHLRSGEVSEAQRRLAGADPALRGWEWQHLFLKSDSSAGMFASGGAPVALGVSSDGRRVFWLSAFGVLRTADSHTLQELPLLVRPSTGRAAEGPPEYIIGVSPDGTRYASVAWAGYGVRVTRRDGDRRFLQYMRGAVSSDDENAVFIKESATGEVVARLSTQIGGEWTSPNYPYDSPKEGQGIFLPAVAVFSPDGKYAATWSEPRDAVIRIHDIARAVTIAELSGHGNVITAGEFSPDARYFLSGSYDGTVRLWDLQSHNPGRVISYDRSVWAVRFSPDGRLVASGGADRLVKVCDLTGTLVATLRGHAGGVQALAFAPDGRRLASAAGDRSIRVWSIPFASAAAAGGSIRISNETVDSPSAVLLGHTQTVTTLAFTPDGSQLVSGSIDNTIRIWDLNRSVNSTSSPLGPGLHHLVAISRDSRRIAAESSDGFVVVWDRMRSSRDMFSTGHRPAITDLGFTLDGTGLVSVSAEDVRVWDAETRRLISTRVWPERFYKVFLLPDAQRVIELTRNGEVRMWKVEGSDPPVSLAPGFDRPSDDYVPMAASSNNQRVAVANSGQLVVWDLARQTRLQLIDLSALDIASLVDAVSLSPNGTQVASGSEDGTLRLWDVKSGQLLYQYSAHDGPVSSLAFDPSGTRIMSASSKDRYVRVWRAQPRSTEIQGARGSLQLGEPLLALEHDGAVQGVKISGNGTVLATWERGRLRLWGSESAYAVDARLTADLLRARKGTSAEAAVALSADASLTPAAEHDVLRYLAAQGDDLVQLQSRAWQIVSKPGHSTDDYTRALELARSAIQISPWPPGGSLNRTLGAVYYRLGRYTEALASLQSALRLHSETEPDPATLAFTAMANQRLGRSDDAHAALARLEDLLKKGTTGVPDAGLAREAATVVLGATLPSK